MGEIVVNALGTEVQWRNQIDRLYSQVKLVTIMSQNWSNFLPLFTFFKVITVWNAGLLATL